MVDDFNTEGVGILKIVTKTTRLVETANLGADNTAGLRENLEALRQHPGDRDQDEGCGNGLSSIEATHTTAPDKAATSVDLSPNICNLAITRTKDTLGSTSSGPYHRFSFAPKRRGQGNLGSYFELLSGFLVALNEAQRSVYPNGLLAVGDMSFGTLV